MKIVAIALVALFVQVSYASVSRTYVCRSDEKRPPRPIAYVTVTGLKRGGHSVDVAVSIPKVRQGGRFTRTLTKTLRCPQDQGSKPDYTCNFREERYRVDVPLTLSSMPEYIRVVNLSSKWGVTLPCELKER